MVCRFKTNIHGISKQYFQIGGVFTDEDYRQKGYAKQVISALCRYYFNKGIKTALLFTDKTNYPAQKLYKNIGFKPADHFIIAEY